MRDYPLYATLIEENGKKSKKNLSYYLDPNMDEKIRDRVVSRQYERGSGSSYTFTTNVSRLSEYFPTMKGAYVYLIKDPDMEIFDKLQ